MRVWGSLLAVAVLLLGAACTRDVRGLAVAGDPPVRETSTSPAKPTRVEPCTDCDDDTIKQTARIPS